MAVIRIDLAAENRASREVLNLRGEINKLGRQIAENNVLAAKGTAEERRAIAEKNRSIRASQGLLRVEQQRQSIQLANLRQINRESRQASGGMNLLARAGREAVATFGAFVALDAVHYLSEFARGSARAAIQIDSQTRALAVLTGSATEAQRALREIQDLADEPGLRFRQAVDGAVALRAIGTEAETTTRILRELANAAAFSGGGGGEFERGLLGFRQLIQRGRLSQEELNQLTENITLASRVLQQEFGTVLAEDIQAQLDDTGQTIDDFVERVLTGFERLERFPLDAPSVKLKNLSNSFFEFQAAIGDRFLPLIASGADVLTRFFDRITEGIQRTKSLTETLAELNAEITNASGQIELRDAIEGGVGALEAFIEHSEIAIRNNSVFFGGREDAILTGQINQAREALAELVGVQGQSIETEQELRTELALQEAELARIQGLQTDRNTLIAEQGATAERASRIYLEGLREEEDKVVASIETLENKLQAFQEIPTAIDETTQSTGEATEATKELTQEALSLTGIYKGLTAQIQEAAEFFDLIGSTGGAEFFALAQGEIQAYGGAVDVVIPSVIDLTEAENALTAAISANLATINPATDAYRSYAESIDAINVSTDAQTARGNRVNPVIRQQTLATREYATELSTLGVAYQDIETITENAITSSRNQIRTISALRNEFEATDQPLDLFDQHMTEIADSADMASESFEQFRDNALLYIDDISRALDPLIDNLGDTGREIDSLIGAVTSALTGDIPGLIANVLQIVTPGLTDPQRILNFQQPVAGIQAGQPLDLEDLGLNLDFGAAFEGLEFNLPQSVINALARGGEPAIRQRPGPGFRYNATLGRWEPIPEFFDETTGSGLGAPRPPDETRIEAERRYREEVQDIYNDVAEAYQRLEDRKAEITRRAAERRAAAERRYEATVQDIYNSVRDEYNAVEERKVEIAKRATEQRLDAEAVLADAYQQIYNDVRDFYEDAEQQKIEIAERAAEQRSEADVQLAEMQQQIYNDVRDAFEDAEARKVAIAERAAADREDEDERLADVQQDIYNDVRDEFERAELQKIEIAKRAAEARKEAEERLAETQQDIYNDVRDEYNAVEERKTAIADRATEQRTDAEQRYAETVQEINNRLVLDVLSIQDRLNKELSDLNQDALDAEADRLDSLAKLQEDHNRRILELEEELIEDLDDLRRDRNRDASDLNREYQRDLEDLQTETARRLFGEEFGDLTQDQRSRLSEDDTFQRALFDLNRQRQRGVQDFQTDFGILTPGSPGYEFYRQQLESGQLTDENFIGRIFGRQGLDEFLSNQRAVEDLEGRTAQREADINAQAEAIGVAVAEAVTTAQAEATEAILGAEAGAGTTFAEAQANFVPAASAMAMALDTFNTNIASINENERNLLGVAQDSFDKFLSVAGVTLPEALARAETPMTRWAAALETYNENVVDIDTQETLDLAAIDTHVEAFVMAAGVTLPEALARAETPMTRWAAALETYNENIIGIDTQEGLDIGAIDTNLATVLSTAGVDLSTALENASPPMTLMAAALLKHSESIDAINTQEELDLATVDANIAEFIAVAGVTLPEALANATPNLTRWAQAQEDFNTTIADIDANEITLLDTEDENFISFVEAAGVTLPVAMANATPILTRHAQALEDYEASIVNIDNLEIQALDTADASFQEFLSVAGVTLPNALANATSPMSRLASAMENFNEAAPNAPIPTGPSTGGPIVVQVTLPSGKAIAEALLEDGVGVAALENGMAARADGGLSNAKV